MTIKLDFKETYRRVKFMTCANVIAFYGDSKNYIVQYASNLDKIPKDKVGFLSIWDYD